MALDDGNCEKRRSHACTPIHGPRIQTRARAIGLDYTDTQSRLVGFVSLGIIKKLSGRESRHGISGNVFLGHVVCSFVRSFVRSLALHARALHSRTKRGRKFVRETRERERNDNLLTITGVR